MNTFNSADAALSNNTLEAWLLVLQMVQLTWGLITTAADVPNELSTTVYLLVMAAAVVLSLVALSSKLSRALHKQYQLVEPWIHALVDRLGLSWMGWMGGGDPVDENDNSAVEKRKRRQSLLQLAKTIENKQKDDAEEKRRNLAALVVLSEETVGAKARVEATKRHKKELARKKNALQIEHEKFVKRQQAGQLKTQADDIGRLNVTTESVLAYSAEREEREKKREAEKQRMDTARKDWEARKAQVCPGVCERDRPSSCCWLFFFFLFLFLLLFLFCFLSSNDHFSSAVHYCASLAMTYRAKRMALASARGPMR